MNINTEHRRLQDVLDRHQDDLYYYCSTLLDKNRVNSIYHRICLAAAHRCHEIPQNHSQNHSRDHSSYRAELFKIARDIIVLEHLRELSSFEAPELLASYTPIMPIKKRIKSENIFEIYNLEDDAIEILELLLWHQLSIDEIVYILDRKIDEIEAIIIKALAQIAYVQQGPFLS